MKVLFSTPTFIPTITGITYRLKMIIDFMLEKGHEISIITPDKNSITRYKNVKIYKIKSKPLPYIYSSGKHPHVYVYQYKFLYNTIIKILKDKNFDLIHIFGPDICYPFLKVSYICSIPITMSLNTELDTFFNKNTIFPQKVTLKIIKRLVFIWGGIHKIPILFGMSKESIRKHKQKGLITNCQEAKTIIPIINKQLFKKTANKKYGDQLYSNKKFKLIFCGRISSEKRVSFLIDIVKNLNNVELAIIGGGAELNKIKKIVINNRLDKNVFFLGKIDNKLLPFYYSCADVFITASKVETCGFTTLESLSCGLPVLVYPSGGSLDLVEDGYNGFFCKTVEEYRYRINYLIKNKDILRKMSKNAIKSTDKYSVQKSCTQLLKDYEYIIKSKKSVAKLKDIKELEKYDIIGKLLF